MSKRKNVIREHDVVKIINPLFVERVGYPLSIKMVREQMTPEQIAAVKDMFKKLDISIDPSAWDSKPCEGERAYERVIETLARVMLRNKGWGGKTRSLHTKEIPEHKDAITQVLSKRCVKTGIYHHGYCSRDYWGEYDYEPAYLENEKTHILLKLGLYDDNFLMDHLEIDAANVIKLTRDPNSGQWVEPPSKEHPSGLSGDHNVVLDAIHQICLRGR